MPWPSHRLHFKDVLTAAGTLGPTVPVLRAAIGLVGTLSVEGAGTACSEHSEGVRGDSRRDTRSAELRPFHRRRHAAPGARFHPHPAPSPARADQRAGAGASSKTLTAAIAPGLMMLIGLNWSSGKP